MKCVGVDPGGVTGVALVAFEDGRYRLEAHGGLTGSAEETVRDLRAFEATSAPLAVERFVVGRRSARSASSGASDKARNVIGGLVSAFAGRVRLHTASEVKAWATNKRLEAAGLRPSQGLPHSRDAARHALYTLVKHYRCPDPLGSAYRKDTGQCPPDTQ